MRDYFRSPIDFFCVCLDFLLDKNRSSTNENIVCNWFLVQSFAKTTTKMFGCSAYPRLTKDPRFFYGLFVYRLSASWRANKITLVLTSQHSMGYLSYMRCDTLVYSLLYYLTHCRLFPSWTLGPNFSFISSDIWRGPTRLIILSLEGYLIQWGRVNSFLRSWLVW